MKKKRIGQKINVEKRKGKRRKKEEAIVVLVVVVENEKINFLIRVGKYIYTYEISRVCVHKCTVCLIKNHCYPYNTCTIHTQAPTHTGAHTHTHYRGQK